MKFPHLARLATRVTFLLLAIVSSAVAQNDTRMIGAVSKVDAAYSAAFVSQTVPSTMELFKPATVSITMRNTGTQGWFAANGDIFLGTQEPQDNYYWCIQDNRYGIYSGNRVRLPHDVAPGELVTFDFVVKPLSCVFTATAPFRFRMLSPVHGTFGDETPDPAISVTTGAEFADRDDPPSSAHFDRTLPRAQELFPLAERLDTEPWMGARPCTPDMMPIIGPAPRHAGLWFAFGHAHHGLTLGPVTGRLIGEMMTGETPFADPAPYRADRF